MFKNPCFLIPWNHKLAWRAYLVHHRQSPLETTLRQQTSAPEFKEWSAIAFPASLKMRPFPVHTQFLNNPDDFLLLILLRSRSLTSCFTFSLLVCSSVAYCPNRDDYVLTGVNIFRWPSIGAWALAPWRLVVAPHLEVWWSYQWDSSLLYRVTLKSLGWPFPPSASASVFYCCFFCKRIFLWESLRKKQFSALSSHNLSFRMLTFFFRTPISARLGSIVLKMPCGENSHLKPPGRCPISAACVLKTIVSHPWRQPRRWGTSLTNPYSCYR